MTIQIELYQIILFAVAFLSFGLKFYVTMTSRMAVQDKVNKNLIEKLNEMKDLMSDHIRISSQRNQKLTEEIHKIQIELTTKATRA